MCHTDGLYPSARRARIASSVNDSAAEGSHTGTITHTVSSSDANYNGLSVSSVSVSITDNDTAGSRLL